METSAVYSVRFESDWGDPKLKIGFPKHPHTGNIWAVTHDASYDAFQVGQTASKGIRTSAEFGINDDLVSETRNHRGIHAMRTGPVVETPGNYRLRIAADLMHPLLSWVAMIAPSSDWFMGVSSYPLVVDGKWLERVIVPLWALDAGSDWGTTFQLLPKHPRRPLAPITRIEDGLLFPDRRVLPMGRLVIRRRRRGTEK